MTEDFVGTILSNLGKKAKRADRGVWLSGCLSVLSEMMASETNEAAWRDLKGAVDSLINYKKEKENE